MAWKRLPIYDFHPQLKRIRSKLATWKARVLSFPGKMTLVKAVVRSIPVYLMSSRWVPKIILEKIESYCGRFLWRKDGERRGLHLAVGT